VARRIRVPLAVVAALTVTISCQRSETIVGLTTKSNTNPFFVKMREGAEAKASELGYELRTFSGRYDGDNDTQVEAIENLIAAPSTWSACPSDATAVGVGGRVMCFPH